MKTVDEYLDTLRVIRAEFGNFCSAHGDASESDTRSKIIDRILKEVCGWPEADICREEHVERGYIDYTLTVRGRAYIAVEAKRDGVAFTLPKGNKQKTLKISGTLSTDRAVGDAIQQVRGYCDDAGIRYAIATNGDTWIIFRAIREDMSWREGRARIFPSLDYIIDNFTEFWNLMSYAAINAGALEEEFGASQRVSRKLERVVDNLYNADLPLQRNRLHAQLEPLIRTFFENIADQDEIEILERCYVHNASLQVVAYDLNCVITDHMPRFLVNEKTEQVRQGPNNSGNFGQAVKSAVRHARGELFLVLGGIGAGKTTFLKRYQRTVGKDVLDRRTIWFYVDFLKAPLSPIELENFVWNEILSQLRERYGSYDLESRKNIKKVFSGDIKAIHSTALRQLTEGSMQFEKELSPFLQKWQEDLSRYVPGLLSLCKPRQDLTVVVFIDNVDQLSPEYQGQIFLLAQRVTRTARSVTVVSMREESYYTAAIQKTFTAYSNRKFHIASPRFGFLISNRLEYAINVLRRSDEELQVILSSGIELDKVDITDLLTIVQRSIFRKNKEIIRFIESVCFGNMRAALQMFANFLTSGATNVDKMLYIHRREGSYYVAHHEFVKSIMLGDRHYYKEEQSPVMNLFDCSSDKNSSHFTSLRILNALAQKRGENTLEGEGYVNIAELIAHFEDVFDNRSDFIRAMNRLTKRQLVEVNTRSTENIHGASHARITSAGWYYSRRLVQSFQYLDLVLQDTPLNSVEVERKLRSAVNRVDNLVDRDNQKEERMEVRFSRVTQFLNYLHDEEKSEQREFGLTDLVSPIADPIVDKIREAFERQSEFIRTRIRENRERFIDDEDSPFDDEYDIFDDSDT
jgi:hypothetical protein